MGHTVLEIFKKHPNEAAIVGRLLAGYGELEFNLLSLLTPYMHSNVMAAKVLFRLRGEEQRIQLADAIIRERITDSPMKERYAEAISDMGHCRKIRNQYAHCHWGEHSVVGLTIAILEPGMKSNAPMPMVSTPQISYELLVQQEHFFDFVADCLWNLAKESDVTGARLSIPLRPRPKKVPQPRLHNG